MGQAGPIVTSNQVGLWVLAEEMGACCGNALFVPGVCEGKSHVCYEALGSWHLLHLGARKTERQCCPGDTHGFGCMGSRGSGLELPGLSYETRTSHFTSPSPVTHPLNEDDSSLPLETGNAITSIFQRKKLRD